MSNLKPVVFVQGKYGYNSQNTAQQLMLLRALRITSDPKKLREMIGVKTVADVYRTLDKLTMRKEYHAALARKGITFDYIVENIKSEIDSADKASDRLAGLKMLLQSIGLDKYDDSNVGSGGTWEDALIKIKEKEEEKGILEADRVLPEYQVSEPEMPAHIRKAKEEANKLNSQLYE